MLFGIPALLAVGASWCLVGIVMGKAPKKGIEACKIQLIGAMFSILFNLVLAAALGYFSAVELRYLLIGMSIYAVAGFLDCLGVRCLAEGMKRGPNGMVWAIMQSGTVFPFLGGIFLFGVELTFCRGLGIILLLVALIFFGIAQDNQPKPMQEKNRTSWKFWAFLAFALVGIQQNLTNAPSYFPELQALSAPVRALAAAIGALLGSLPGQTGKGFYKGLAEVCSRKLFWFYTLGLQASSLLFAYFLTYPGLDAMANAGAGAVSFPLMVGSCIIGFSLYSLLVLKEKAGIAQILGILLCLTGLCCLSFPK